MNQLKLKINPKVKDVFNNYPEAFQGKLSSLRQLVLETAKEIESIEELEETLKWGEPSYLTKKGSTIRIAWTKSKPNQYAIYFKCTSKLLVPTFKTVYGDKFKYEKNRAILFELEDDMPIIELKHCIFMALTYHSIKHLPLLGAKQ